MDIRELETPDVTLILPKRSSDMRGIFLGNVE